MAEMAFLDTSVVVRYLVGDSPQLAARATELIESSRTLVLSELVLAETAYVLASVYEVRRDAIVDALSQFLLRRNIRLARLSKPRALDALALCRGSKRVSFTDALLWGEARTAGAAEIHTFDEKFPPLHD